MIILHFISVSIFLIAANFRLGVNCYSIRRYYNKRAQILTNALSPINMAGRDSSASPESGYEDKKKVAQFSIRARLYRK